MSTAKESIYRTLDIALLPLLLTWKRPLPHSQCMDSRGTQELLLIEAVSLLIVSITGLTEVTRNYHGPYFHLGLACKPTYSRGMWHIRPVRETITWVVSLVSK